MSHWTAHTSLRAERITRAQLSTGTALDVTLRACDQVHLPYLRTDSHHSHDGNALCLALEWPLHLALLNDVIDGSDPFASPSGACAGSALAGGMGLTLIASDCL
jgi:hypothetical protein